MSLTIIHSSSHQLEQIITNLYRRKESLEECSDGPLSLSQIATIKKIRKYCSQINKERFVRAIFDSAIGTAIQPLLKEINRKYYATQQTNIVCNKLIGKKNCYTISDDILDLHHSKKKEFAFLPNEIGTMVFIEAGSLLESARCVAKMRQYDKIICINSNTEKSLLSKKVARIHNLRNLEIITTPPEKFKYTSIDYVYIPNIVQNKNRLLAQITRTKRSKITILMQYALGLSSLFYRNYSEDFLRYFSREKRLDISRTYSKRQLHILQTI